MLSAKYTSLLAGCLQQTVVVLLIRYSKIAGENVGPSYLNSVAVASSEVFKLCLSFTLEYIGTRNNNDRKGGKIEHFQKTCRPMLICNDRESVKLIVPAILYLIQNNLLFVALANLSVPMYTMTNQGKLLTTALLSRIMLKKQLTLMQYVSIALLGFGVAFIHLSEYHDHAKVEELGVIEGDDDASSDNIEAAANDDHGGGDGQNQILGLIAVLICCFTSSFSGVYFEFVLKKSNTQLSVHCRNFHLASWSLSFAILHILSHDLAQVKEYGLFHGFDLFVVCVVINQGMVGFFVSMMIKHADNVLKGFAISCSVLLSTLLSVPLFGASITSSFVVGASIMGAAVKMFSHYEVKTAAVDVESVVMKKESDEEKQGLLNPMIKQDGPADSA